MFDCIASTFAGTSIGCRIGSTVGTVTLAMLFAESHAAGQVPADLLIIDDWRVETYVDPVDDTPRMLVRTGRPGDPVVGEAGMGVLMVTCLKSHQIAGGAEDPDERPAPWLIYSWGRVLEVPLGMIETRVRFDAKSPSEDVWFVFAGGSAAGIYDPRLYEIIPDHHTMIVEVTDLGGSERIAHRFSLDGASEAIGRVGCKP